MSDLYEERIAKIESVNLGYEDNGVFSVLLGFDYGDATPSGIWTNRAG